MDLHEILKQKYELLFPHLSARQRQLVAAADAEVLGRGKVSLIARLAGFSRPTLYRAMEELKGEPAPAEPGRRLVSGRRKRIEEHPELLQDLDALIDPAPEEDAAALLRWTCLGSRELARRLTQRGHVVSHELVAQLLAQLGYRHQTSGPRHPQRQAQFEYVHQQAQQFLAAGLPVVWVYGCLQDAPPRPAAVHTNGSAVREEGRRRADPRAEAQFLVDGLRCWWHGPGQRRHAQAGRLLLCADAVHTRDGQPSWWLIELQRWLTETGLEACVCHLPAGTMRWRRLESQLALHVPVRQGGAPDAVFEAHVGLVAPAREQGPAVPVEHLDAELALANDLARGELTLPAVSPHAFYGQWNYTIKCAPPSVSSPPAAP